MSIDSSSRSLVNSSVVILTKNEENNIVDCIESVEFLDEIIVIDDNSSDRTLDLIKNLNNKKIKVYKRNLNNNFSDQRNFGLDKAKGEWVLFLDADERVSDNLKFEIDYAISSRGYKGKEYSGFFLRRIDYLWGKELKHGETGDIKFLRLAKKEKGRWRGLVHENWQIKGSVATLDNPIIHYPHQKITDFLKELNYYSSLKAKELYERRKKINFFSIIFYPSAKFAVNYFLKHGILDGIHGFVFAVFMSMHSFMVRAKHWEMIKTKR